MEKLFWRHFSKRSLVCFIIIILLFFITVLKITVISTSNYSEVQKNSSSLKIKITSPRGTIFDCNKYAITNSKKKIIACISPTPRAMTAISQVLEKDELKNVFELLKNGKPVTCEVPKTIDCEGIICTEIYTDEETIPAIHTIGYTDSNNNGVSGIQKAYDDILRSENDVFIRYACDGKGRILPGVAPELENDFSPYLNAVITTIDINIQKIVESACQNLELGAIIVADAKTAKIRGIASRPTYRVDNIKELLNDKNTPLFNRALGAYNVGSVFKLCIAAAGCENGFEGFCYNCKGSFKIIDRTFRCHEHKGHGQADLSFAIANSCNTYFYNLAINIGQSEISKYTNILNFGRSIKLCDSIYTAKGNLPSDESLENIAHLANFSIGQGDFTATPVSMLPLYCAIANEGKYYLPSLVESTIQNGKQKDYDIGFPTKAFSKKTAQKLKEALSRVIEEGTGTLARPQTVTAGGKTATAQTGKFENGREINSSWFCGLFPLETPEYVVIIFSENAKRQAKSCAEIFAEIADKINVLP